MRFNLRGRERDGVVDPADAGALAEEITAGLATFTDPAGAPAVASVERVADRYRGATAERLPDLVVHWSERPATRLELVRSRRFGTVRRRGAGSGRSGNHTPGGAWAILAPGRSALRDPGRTPRLADVAATVASLCGAPAEGLTGEPLLADRAGERRAARSYLAPKSPSLESASPQVKVLLTNDDGIQAEGLHAIRRELRDLDGVEVHVIAPNSNRSATARSITTRSPLWIEEIRFDDGEAGFATDGTPVDCVRFADLGLLGAKPDLIISGINHGANLGDDITYSGTVAAALEGIVLGIPAVAMSQQSEKREMGFRFGRSFDFSHAARFGAELVRRLGEEKAPPDTLINVNFPTGTPQGIEVTRLGKRLYDDELKLVDEDSDGRRRYEIYGFEPSFEDEEGTDLVAIARGRIALTPIHFDLTDHEGLERLRAWDLEAMLAARRRERRRRRPRARRRAAARDRGAQPPLLRPRRPDGLRRGLRRAAERAARPRGGAPGAAHPRLAHPAGRGPARWRSSSRCATRSRCSRSATPAVSTSSAPGRRACTTSSSASTSSRAICVSSRSRRSTGSRSRSPTRTACSPAAPPAATASPART